jgi:superfamily II DNA or RNA helicase
MSRKPRDYQEEYERNLLASIQSGCNKNLIVSPTGSGKGFLIGRAPKCLAMKRGEKMLVVVHRKDLVTQLAESLREENPDLNVDIERAHLRASEEADIIVASVQSIGKSSGISEQGTEDYNDRLRGFDASQFRHIIVDEAHLAPKAGGDFHRVLRYFNVSKRDFLNDDPTKTLTCYTATANRSDNIGMENIVDAMPFSRDILTLMKTGLQVGKELRPWLSPVRSFRCNTEANISGVSTRQGDFAIKELEDAVNTQARNELIVEKHRELGEGMTFFAYTVDCQHTNDLAATFQRAGFKAYPYSGTTPDGERRRLMAAMRAREIDGLISCDALSVGVDVPSVAVLHFARPTKSPLLFQQQFGRGTRPFPAPEQYAGWNGWVKPYCITIDYVDVCSKHPAQSVPNLFGLRPDFNLKGKKVTEALEEVEKLVAKAPGVNLTLFTDIEKLRGAVQEINLFGKPTIPEEITRNSQLAWTTGMAAGIYQLSFENKLLTIQTDTLGRFQIFRNVNGVRTPLGQASDLQRALSLAEIEVPSEWYVRLQADAQWRFQPPTEAQLNYYARLYPEVRKLYATDLAFAEGIKKRYDKGELSMLITQRAKPRGKPAWVGRGA